MINERELKKEISALDDSIKQVFSEIETLKSTVSQPVKLRAIKHGNGYQYFQRKKGSETNGEYIRKKEIHKAITLAQIEYDERLLIMLRESKEALEKYRSSGMINPFKTAIRQMATGKGELVKPRYISDEDYIIKWRGQEYEGLSFKDNFPEYYTRSGLRVRSKSEILIADMLDEMNIPFLYEKPLQLKRKMLHPDFTLLNIKKRKEVYWEHFGMMDDREYKDEALLKIREYEANGFYQYDSVICTFESGKSPMNTRDIRNMVGTLRELLGYSQYEGSDLR